MSAQVTVLRDVHSPLGEGPCWDPTTQRLYWVDIDKGHVNVLNPHVRPPFFASGQYTNREAT